MRHITKEKNSTIPGEMNTISFQKVRSAPKSFSIAYEFYSILWTPLRQPAIQ